MHILTAVLDEIELHQQHHAHQLGLFKINNIINNKLLASYGDVLLHRIAKVGIAIAKYITSSSNLSKTNRHRMMGEHSR